MHTFLAALLCFTSAASSRHLFAVDNLSTAQTLQDSATSPYYDDTPLVARGAPANQPHGYAPQTGSCPSTAPTARSAASLSSDEVSWLASRRNATIDPLRTLLSRMNFSGFDAAQYINNHSQNVSALPNIGIAVSGGGYRAMLNGAGVIAAFDNRTINATSSGHLGGLLQSATYLSALSGGGWLVGSLYSNNFTSVQNIVDQSANADNDLWQLSNSIFEGPSSGHSHLLSSLDYYGDLIKQVKAKDDAGFNITITDYWGRALSYQLINATDGGPDYTFSSIASQDWFSSGSVPLPILVSDGRAPGTEVVSLNSTVFEFNPWELGSFDPTAYAFTPLKYLGTNYTAGKPLNDQQCVTGFDSASFVMGTSSSLFNAVLTTINGTSTSGLVNTALKAAITSVLEAWGESDTDIASYPNPFYQYGIDNSIFRSAQLTLVDGGEDNQNIPLTPLIQPPRQVDVIFAVDSSADTTDSNPVQGSAANWPDGASLVATYQRSLSSIGNGTAFPAVPDTNTFFNLGLARGPTFFGCDSKNLTGPSPLIVYLPNGPYSYNSNTSTYDMDYEPAQRNAIINNAYNMATQGNGTLDSGWSTCVGCAILSRSFDRTGTTVPDVCTKCFTKYCWNGTTDARTPQVWQPTAKLQGAATNVTTASSSSATPTGAASKSRDQGMLLVLSAFSALRAFLL
ncbi:hypothetical protein AMS68_007134 [Peltaster fructicola]|uniref:Lysophospholipase n=1 Tax=Peltaster fructicola TaxID=286661 RepID=A0A6H0Y3M4_9PEZI|nr:hypothetical protein AMS68_007134 [Peltaster fructicola]